MNLVPIALCFYSMLAPFTKVEESFNMQATYDLIYSNYSDFDHFQFPGVVPRTFIGPLLVALPLYPFSYVLDKTSIMYLVRLLMALYQASSFSYLHSAIAIAHGKNTAFWFSLLTASQFHLMFWGSRLLPNMFALMFFNIALALWIKSSSSEWLISLLVFTCVVFRAELALISAFILLYQLSSSQYTFPFLLKIGLFAFFVSVITTVSIDSIYWNQRFLWPELNVFVFNGVMQRSIEWGSSPWHYYFTNLLPKIAPVSLFIVLVSLTIRPAKLIFKYIAPVLIHLTALSIISHKEWRFILYVVPLINLLAALSIPQSKYARFLCKSLILCSFCVSFIMAYASSYNYPGGAALEIFHNKYATADCNVHIDACSAMQGITRFSQKHCIYNKSEQVTDFGSFSHLISCKFTQPFFEVVELVDGYNGIGARGIKLSPKVAILRNTLNPN
jgi:alpha-1,6-mannosyltransferase